MSVVPSLVANTVIQHFTPEQLSEIRELLAKTEYYYLFVHESDDDFDIDTMRYFTRITATTPDEIVDAICRDDRVFKALTFASIFQYKYAERLELGHNSIGSGDEFIDITFGDTTDAKKVADWCRKRMTPEEIRDAVIEQLSLRARGAIKLVNGELRRAIIRDGTIIVKVSTSESSMYCY